MKLDVSELAERCALSVDTIRYYQSQGLLHAPEREGRRAFYDASHLERLERIRAMAERGFSLKAIRAVIHAGATSESDRLLLSAVEQEASGARYSSADLARELGIPRDIVTAIEKAGLVEADEGADRLRGYSALDLRVARTAVKLLRRGFPVTRLVRLGVRHDRAVRKTVDEAIDLFDEHVRKSRKGPEADPEAVAQAFRELLPAVTTLIAHHFERTLVNRALKRLKKSGERAAYAKAVAAASEIREGRRTGA